MLAAMFLPRQEAKASHIAAADIYYQHIGGDTFKIVLTLYRDCGGITMGTSEIIDIVSATCGVTTTRTANLVSTTEISQLCAGSLAQSSCNGGTLPGLERYIYEATYVLPQSCTDWTFSWTTCCRNGLICNIAGASGESIYVQTTYNSTLGINSAPFFTTNPAPYYCVGQQVFYNPGAVDLEGDSLAFQLITPLGTGPADPVTFNPPYTAQNPFVTSASSFAFDPATGCVTFTAAGGCASGIYAVRVFEYRNGVLIGTTMRDLQFVFIQSAFCSANQVPQPQAPTGFTNICNSSPITFTPSPGACNVGGVISVCSGSCFTFLITVTDANPNDTISITSNISDVLGPGAALIAIPGTSPLQVAVFVPAVNESTSFTITYSDDACDVNGVQVVGYQIYIANVNINANDTLLFCSGVTDTLNLGATTSSLLPGVYQWSQISGPPITLNNPNSANAQIIIPDTLQTTVQFAVSWTDTLCVVYDTITIEFGTVALDIDITASLDTLCGNNMPQTTTLTADISGNDSYYFGGTFSWAGPGTIASPTSPVTGITLAGPSTGVYTVTYAKGNCVSSESFPVYFATPTYTLTPQIDTFCAGDQVCFGSATGGGTSPTRFNAWLSADTSYFQSDCNVYVPTPITFAPVVMPATATTVSLPDDGMSGALPIGFPFEFFCTTYTQFDLSSNGFLTFDQGTFANGCCSGPALPNANTPNNLIAFCWEDLDPGNGGQPAANLVRYATIGTAPNRRLVIQFFNVDHFPTGNNVTVQCILYEGSNWIEVHTTTQPDATGFHTMGVENAGGTIAYTVPGRNGQSWTATNDAWRIAPFLINIPSPVTYNLPSIGAFGLNNDTACASFNVTTNVPVTANWAEYPNCTFTDTFTVVIGGDLAAPIQNNCAGTATSATIGWGPVAGATGYEVSLDAGATWTPQAGTSYTATGLINGQCLEITVRATGGANTCGNFANFFSCCAVQCMNLQAVTTPAQCFGATDGTASVDAIGASTPIVFVLNGLPGGPVSQISNTTTSATFTGLGVGSYLVEVLDATGCSDTITVFVGSAPPFATNVSSSVETCNGNGSATVVPLGGIPGYTYLWNDAAGQTTATATNLVSGDYIVTVTDNNGCQAIDTVTVGFDGPEITTSPDVTVCPGQSTILTANMTSGGSAVGCGLAANPCAGPVALVSVGNGTTPLSTIQGTPFNGFFEAGRVQMLYKATDLLAAGLARGQISAMSFDVLQKNSTQPFSGFNVKMGCTALDSLGATFETGLTTVFSGNYTTTAGTNNILFATNYEWDGVSDLLLEVCFTNNSFSFSDVVEGSSTAYPSTISAENDNVNGCNLPANRTLSLRPNIEFVNCQSTSYTWTPGATLNDSTLQSPTATPTQTTTYIVTAFDGACTTTDTVVVTVAGGLNAPITQACSNVLFNTLTFNWNNIPAASGFEVSLDGGTTWIPANGTNGISHTVSNLAPGSSVTIEVRAVGGISGCPNASATITCTTPTCGVPSVTTTDVACFGTNNGSVVGVVTGATGPYDFTLTQGGSTIGASTGTSFTNATLGAGNYVLEYLEPSTGCTDTVHFSISGPVAPIVLNGSSTPVTCYLGTNGTATVTSFGGTAPYTYLWPNGQTTATATTLGVAAYVVTVTDDNGCTATLSVDVFGPSSQFVVDITTNAPSCSYSSDATAIAIVNSAGTVAYTWSTGATTAQITGLSAGQVVTVDVTINGCGPVTATATVGTTPVYSLNIASTEAPCVDASNGEIVVGWTNGVGTASFVWTGSTSTSNVATGLAAGTYSVTGTDGNGCTATISETLVAFTPLTLNIASTEAPCVDASNGEIVVGWTNSNGNVNFTWTGSTSTSNVATGLNAGSYTVTATDAEGCTASISETLVAVTPLTLSVDTILNPCDGQTNGSISVEYTNANEPVAFTWTANANSTSNFAFNIGAGTYAVTATDAEGCTASTSGTLVAIPNPNVNANLDGNPTPGTLFTGLSYTLAANTDPAQSGVTYTWVPSTYLSNANAFDPTVLSNTQDTVLYTVFADFNGCTSVDTITLIFLTSEVALANAFIPGSSEALNQVFTPFAPGPDGGYEIPANILVKEFKIFNRWGEVVYDDAVNHRWDGTDKDTGNALPRDVYIYRFVYELNGQTITKTGDVTLIR
jgi:hypothetical protein